MITKAEQHDIAYNQALSNAFEQYRACSTKELVTCLNLTRKLSRESFFTTHAIAASIDVIYSLLKDKGISV